jgi:hypothetical protein
VSRWSREALISKHVFKSSPTLSPQSPSIFWFVPSPEQVPPSVSGDGKWEPPGILGGIQRII